MRAIFIFVFLLLFLPAFAVSILAPVSTEVRQGSEIEIGNVGPGQTFYIIAEPRVATGGKYGLGGAYDQMFVTSLPEGWSGSPSKLYAKPLQVEVTVPKDAQDGEYETEITLWDEAGEIGLGENLTFTAKVKVTSDVMDMFVEPPFISVGAGQPARYSITILNKGIANDVFTVSAKGVRGWEFQRSIYVPAASSRTISYEVVGTDEEDYSVRILASSSSSDKISAEAPVSLQVRTDLFSDFRAVNNGVLLLPLIEAPIYFAVGFLSNFI